MSRVIKDCQYKCCICNKELDRKDMFSVSYCKKCYRDYMREYMRKRRKKI